MPYKVIKGRRNIFGRETFKTKSDAHEAQYYVNKGAKAMGMKSVAYGSRVVLVKKRR